MQEENTDPSTEDPQDDSQSSAETGPPSDEVSEGEPLPQDPPEQEKPEMSEIGTVFNIFLEPGRTFRDLRKKPRFIIAGIIIAILSGVFVFGFQQKLGEDRIRRFVTIQAEKNAQFASLPEDQKKSNLDLQMTISKVVSYVSPVFVIISFLIGGLLYWGGNKLLGGEAGFKQSLSIWIYASLPPAVLGTIANVIVLVLKDPDDIDIATSQRGLVTANPTAFFDGKEMPVLATVISIFDLFVIWGMILAAIGLKKVARLSTGSAWAIVLIFALVFLTFRVFFAYLNGIPQ